MQCPICKISTLIRRRGDAVVSVCRNKRCKNYDKTVRVIEVLPPPQLTEEQVEGECAEEQTDVSDETSQVT